MTSLPAVLLELPALERIILPKVLAEADRARLQAARPQLQIR